LDPGARSRRRDSVEGQLLVVARAEAGASAPRRESGIAAAEDARARTGVDTHVAEGTPREREGANQRIRIAADAGSAAEDGRAGDLYSARPAARQRRHRVGQGT